MTTDEQLYRDVLAIMQRSLVGAEAEAEAEAEFDKDLLLASRARSLTSEMLAVFHKHCRCG